MRRKKHFFLPLLIKISQSVRQIIVDVNSIFDLLCSFIQYSVIIQSLFNSGGVLFSVIPSQCRGSLGQRNCNNIFSYHFIAVKQGICLIHIVTIILVVHYYN